MLANTRTATIREKQGVMRDVARLIKGSSSVAPPTDPVHIQRCFGDLKGFRAVDELVMIVTGRVLVSAVVSGADLERVLRYGNHSSITKHLPAIWKKIGEDVRRQECSVRPKSAAHEIPNLGVSPLAAVVTHKVRIINNNSFDVQSSKKRGLNGDTDPDAVP